LADPVHWLANEPVPVADVTPGGPAGGYVLPDGSFVRPPGERPDGTTLEYVQYTRRTAEPEVGPGFHPAGPPDRVFVTNPVGRVKDYADGVVRAGVAAGRLPAALDRLPAALPPPAEFHEAIAREFARHLSEHPELRYTTAVRRGNREVDPVEDFLFFTKAGHCERFASALVLMLRSQAIPSVLVLGFKGCESAGDGRYVVRQEFAHAWAEAMVVRPAPPGVRATRQWHWLTLDPSPASTAEPADQAGADGLLGRVRTLGRETVGKYLVNYTRERRDEALRAVWDFVRHPATVAGAAGLVGLGIAGWAVWRVARRRRAARADGVNRLAPLYAALAGMGYRPNPGDTPLEFARTATAGLRGRGLTEADDVAVPVEWVEGYYRDRFGGEPGDEARAGLDARLAGLRDALRAKSGVPT
ncbi:MAG: transglutaminase-like domain-containing protein, partial [Gemmataceae bacterium]|nr:transglutaminase-like domain-containing protein [Gemmataceae bacterium]